VPGTLGSEGLLANLSRSALRRRSRTERSRWRGVAGQRQPQRTHAEFEMAWHEWPSRFGKSHSC